MDFRMASLSSTTTSISFFDLSVVHHVNYQDVRKRFLLACPHRLRYDPTVAHDQAEYFNPEEATRLIFCGLTHLCRTSEFFRVKLLRYIRKMRRLALWIRRVMLRRDQKIEEVWQLWARTEPNVPMKGLPDSVSSEFLTTKDHSTTFTKTRAFSLCPNRLSAKVYSRMDEVALNATVCLYWSKRILYHNQFQAWLRLKQQKISEKARMLSYLEVGGRSAYLESILGGNVAALESEIQELETQPPKFHFSPEVITTQELHLALEKYLSMVSTTTAHCSLAPITMSMIARAILASASVPQSSQSLRSCSLWEGSVCSGSAQHVGGGELFGTVSSCASIGESVAVTVTPTNKAKSLIAESVGNDNSLDGKPTSSSSSFTSSSFSSEKPGLEIFPCASAVELLGRREFSRTKLPPLTVDGNGIRWEGPPSTCSQTSQSSQSSVPSERERMATESPHSGQSPTSLDSLPCKPHHHGGKEKERSPKSAAQLLVNSPVQSITEIFSPTGGKGSPHHNNSGLLPVVLKSLDQYQLYSPSHGSSCPKKLSSPSAGARDSLGLIDRCLTMGEVSPSHHQHHNNNNHWPSESPTPYAGTIVATSSFDGSLFPELGMIESTPSGNALTPLPPSAVVCRRRVNASPKLSALKGSSNSSSRNQSPTTVAAAAVRHISWNIERMDEDVDVGIRHTSAHPQQQQPSRGRLLRPLTPKRPKSWKQLSETPPPPQASSTSNFTSLIGNNNHSTSSDSGGGSDNSGHWNELSSTTATATATNTNTASQFVQMLV